MLLVDFLHELPHQRALGAGMLPELPGHLVLHRSHVNETYSRLVKHAEYRSGSIAKGLDGLLTCPGPARFRNLGRRGLLLVTISLQKPMGKMCGVLWRMLVRPRLENNMSLTEMVGKRGKALVVLLIMFSLIPNYTYYNSYKRLSAKIRRRWSTSLTRPRV